MTPRRRSTRTRPKRAGRPVTEAPAIESMPLRLPTRTTLTGGDVDVDEGRTSAEILRERDRHRWTS